MNDMDDELKGLQKELERREDEIAGAQASLQDAQKKLGAVSREKGALAARIAALKSQRDEVKASRSAIEDEPAAAQGGIDAAREAFREAAVRLERQVPENRMKAVVEAVKAVDDEIAAKRTVADELRGKLADAEKRLAEAQGQMSRHDQAADGDMAQLKNLAGQIRAARGRLPALVNGIKSAMKSGQTNKAIHVLEQYRQAMVELEALIDPQREDELVGHQAGERRKAAQAKAEVAARSEEWERLRRELAAAENAYQIRATGREAAIEAKLSTLPEGEPVPPRETSATEPAGSGSRA